MVGWLVCMLLFPFLILGTAGTDCMTSSTNTSARAQPSQARSRSCSWCPGAQTAPRFPQQHQWPSRRNTSSQRLRHKYSDSVSILLAIDVYVSSPRLRRRCCTPHRSMLWRSLWWGCTNTSRPRTAARPARNLWRSSSVPPTGSRTRVTEETVKIHWTLVWKVRLKVWSRFCSAGAAWHSVCRSQKQNSLTYLS